MESVDFGSHLEPFLHERTQHFMHELICFAKSPYDMIAYDNKVRYNWPETHPQAQQQSREGAGDANSPPGIHCVQSANRTIVEFQKERVYKFWVRSGGSYRDLGPLQLRL